MSRVTKATIKRITDTFLPIDYTGFWHKNSSVIEIAMRRMKIVLPDMRPGTYVNLENGFLIKLSYLSQPYLNELRSVNLIPTKLLKLVDYNHDGYYDAWVSAVLVQPIADVTLRSAKKAFKFYEAYEHRTGFNFQDLTLDNCGYWQDEPVLIDW